MPIIETGHAKNVANFEDFISFVNGYGATYDKDPHCTFNLQAHRKRAKRQQHFCEELVLRNLISALSIIHQNK